MRFVLDTCAILWSVLDPDELSVPAREAITAEDAEIYVSPISCAEVARGVERGRIHLTTHWKSWFRHFTDLNGWALADIDLRIVEESYSLPEYDHRDPADRLIIATARLLQCAVVTADARMRRYPHVETVW